MRHRLSADYIESTLSQAKWMAGFIVIALIFAIAVALQMLGDRFLPMAGVLLAVVGLVIFEYYKKYKISIEAAPKVWLEIFDEKIIYGHQYGEEVIYLSNLRKADLGKGRWPKLKLTLSNGGGLTLQGFDSIEEIAKTISLHARKV